MKKKISLLKAALSEEIFKNYIDNFTISKNFSCINPEHEDNHPSMSYNSKDNTIHCFGCGKTYDIFSVLSIYESLTIFKDQYNFIIENYNKKYNIIDKTEIDTEQSYEEPQKNKTLLSYTEWAQYVLNLQDEEATNYLKERGIDITKVSKSLVGFDKQNKTLLFANIYPSDNSIISYTARKINAANKADRYKKQGEQRLFNSQNLIDNDTIFIVEGAFDSISIEMLDYNSIALGSTTSIKALIDFIKRNSNITNLKQKTYIIALDNDLSGHQASIKLENELKNIDCENVYIADNLYSSYKDANECLINEKESFKSRLEKWALNPYSAKYSASGYFNTFLKNINDSKYNKPTPTGYELLDTVLGGLYNGLYVLGAISSLGKTTFVLQMADQIAAQGKDVLIISLEMSKQELIAKSISRYTYKIFLNDEDDIYSKEHCKTTLGILDGSRYVNYDEKSKNLIKLAMSEYSKISSNIYLIEAQDNININKIRHIVEQHKNTTGNAPIVILDYLQILPSVDPRLTEKIAADYNIKGLKTISRDFNTPVIVISSFNRESYNKTLSMSSFKESGGIEYGCDILLGLQFKQTNEHLKENDILELKRNDIRTVELVILKNRNGKLFSPLLFNYNTLFNCFEEEGFNNIEN